MIIKSIFSFLAIALSAYSFLLFLRILLGWFPNASYSNGKIYRTLCCITDPFLFFFNKFKFLQIGRMNFSPIASLCILTILINVCFGMSSYGTYTINMFLYSVINVLWSAISFIIGFLVLVLLLRLAAFIFRASLYNSFWQIIEMISKPVMQKISSIFFRHRIARWLTVLLAAIFSLSALYAILALGVRLLGKILLG